MKIEFGKGDSTTFGLTDYYRLLVDGLSDVNYCRHIGLPELALVEILNRLA